MLKCLILFSVIKTDRGGINTTPRQQHALCWAFYKMNVAAFLGNFQKKCFKSFHFFPHTSLPYTFFRRVKRQLTFMLTGKNVQDDGLIMVWGEVVSGSTMYSHFFACAHTCGYCFCMKKEHKDFPFTLLHLSECVAAVSSSNDASACLPGRGTQCVRKCFTGHQPRPFLYLSS